jgi:hypothetical protein
MDLEDELKATASARRPEVFADFANDLTDKIILEACLAVGYKDQRKRKLPVESLVWLVIGMAIFRDRSISNVVGHLHLWRGPTQPTEPAVVQRRQALGAEALELIFNFTAEEWALASAEKHRWRGLALFGVDGVTARISDSLTNEAYFGRPPSRPDKHQSGYPQLRMVGLMALRSHLLLGAHFGPYATSEQELADAIWPLLPKGSLVLFDKGFTDFGLWWYLTHRAEKTDFLTRAKINMRYRVIRSLGKWDDLIEVTFSPESRRADPSLPETMILRAIRYQKKGFHEQLLVTSLLDPEQYPAAELRELYHERWEIELGYDEIKTHTLEQEESLRSQSPELVKQEMWGVLIAYNLVRKQMEKFADKEGCKPNEVSYRSALLEVRNVCIAAAMGAEVRKLIDQMDANIQMVLPKRRARSYERHVKVKTKRYRRNPGRSRGKCLN